jgi:hypothetical protein
LQVGLGGAVAGLVGHALGCRAGEESQGAGIGVSREEACVYVGLDARLEAFEVAVAGVAESLLDIGRGW